MRRIGRTFLRGLLRAICGDLIEPVNHLGLATTSGDQALQRVATDTFAFITGHLQQGTGFSPWPRRRCDRMKGTNVRYWPKADIRSCTAHVRFWGQSGHDRLRMSAFAVAIGCKADMALCTAYVRL